MATVRMYSMRTIAARCVNAQGKRNSHEADGVTNLYTDNSPYGILKFASNSHRSSFLFRNVAKTGFEMCFGPSTLGAGAKARLKARLESRIKKFTPHFFRRYPYKDIFPVWDFHEVAGMSSETEVPLLLCSSPSISKS